MKVIYPIALIMVPGFILTSLYFRNACLEALFVMYDNGESYLIPITSYDYHALLEKTTFTGSLSGLVFEAFFIFYFIRAIQDLRAFFTRMINLIAAALSVIAFLLTLIPVINPGELYFPGIAILLISYGILMLPCCIVNFIQAKKSTFDTATGKGHRA
jgi:hypothetical protein